MPAGRTLLAFALVSLGITVIPGPSTLFIFAEGVAHGRRRAMAAMGGIEAACAIRVLASAAGLSALLASSPLAFDAVRWAGVAYLAYLGIRSLRSATTLGSEGGAATGLPPTHATRKGLLVGLGNPKMAVFFLAFFPQFIHPGRGSAAEQILILGAVFWVVGVVVDFGVVWASSSISARLRDRPRIKAATTRAEGATYLALAGWAAISGG